MENRYEDADSEIVEYSDLITGIIALVYAIYIGTTFSSFWMGFVAFFMFTFYKAIIQEAQNKSIEEANREIRPYLRMMIFATLFSSSILFLPIAGLSWHEYVYYDDVFSDIGASLIVVIIVLHIITMTFNYYRRENVTSAILGLILGLSLIQSGFSYTNDNFAEPGWGFYLFFTGILSGAVVQIGYKLEKISITRNLIIQSKKLEHKERDGKEKKALAEAKMKEALENKHSMESERKAKTRPVSYDNGMRQINWGRQRINQKETHHKIDNKKNINQTTTWEGQSKPFDYFAENVSFGSYNLYFTSLGKIKMEAIFSGLEADTKFTSTQIDGLVRAIDKDRDPKNSKINIMWHNIAEGKSSDKFENISSFAAIDGKPYVFMYLYFPDDKLWFRLRGDQDLDFEKIGPEEMDENKEVKMIMKTPRTLEVEDVVIENDLLTNQKLIKIYTLIDIIRTNPSNFEFTAHFFYDPLLSLAQEYLNDILDPSVEVSINTANRFRRSLDFEKMPFILRRRLTLELLLFFMMLLPNPSTFVNTIKSAHLKRMIDFDLPPTAALRTSRETPNEFNQAVKVFQKHALLYRNPLHSLNTMFVKNSEVQSSESYAVCFGAAVVLAGQITADPSKISLLDGFVKLNIFQKHHYARDLAGDEAINKSM